VRSRILYIENGQFGGGSAESLAQLVGGLDRESFEPQALFTSPIPAVARIAEMGVQTFLLRHWYVGRTENQAAALAARAASIAVNYGGRIAPGPCTAVERHFTRSLRIRAAELIRSCGAALVHTNNNPHRDLWAIEAAAGAGVPCIAHLRSFHGFGFTSTRARIANRHVTTFIAYSRSIAEYWIGLGLAAERVQVIPNAIGEIRYAPSDLGAVLGTAPKGPVVGLIGRLIPVRRYDWLLDALPRLRQEFPGIRVLVVGGGEQPGIRALERRAESLGVHDSVVFAGHRNDALGILAALDAIVLPYAIEPFGRVLLEAWQLGVPAVLSRVGHIAEVVSDGDDAVLFDPAVPGDLARRLGEVLREKGLRARLVANGRRNCAERFSIGGHCRRVESVYRQTLDCHPGLAGAGPEGAGDAA